jgi:hypothetical protein
MIDCGCVSALWPQRELAFTLARDQDYFITAFEVRRELSTISDEGATPRGD